MTEARYFEEWNEWITQTCTSTSTDADGNTTTTSYDCSHSSTNYAYWEIIDNIGSSHHISQNEYRYLVGYWGKEKFTDLNRDFYTEDGDMYSVSYPNDFSKLIPVCTRHYYVNKVRSSRSVFNFQKVSQDEKTTYKLFDYPKMDILNYDILNYNPIFGWNNYEDSKLLQRYNGLFGAFKRVHMLILVFNDQPYQAGMLQEAYWKGGNKNEFILCIGLNKKKITWTKVISWTDVEILKTQVAREVKELDTINMPVVIDLMSKEVKAKFIKKNFRDFDYITIEPSDRAILIAFILTIVSTIGLFLFSILNNFDTDGYNYKRGRRW